MKKLLLFILPVFIFSCGSDAVKKPERLLSEEQMENILYDLALLQTMSSVTPGEVQQNDINVKDYIYNKYNIDSLTLLQNQKYYAYDMEHYQKIHKRVADRLKTERTPLDSLDKNSRKISPKNKRIKPVVQ